MAIVLEMKFTLSDTLSGQIMDDVIVTDYSNSVPRETHGLVFSFGYEYTQTFTNTPCDFPLSVFCCLFTK